MEAKEFEIGYQQQGVHIPLERVKIIRWQLKVKRLIDVIGALIGLIAFFPIMLIIAILIYIESPGPVLFRQQRVGQYGKPFTILKFRSMCVDAEERLRKDSKLYRKYVENNYKLPPEEDPRITKIGRFLRKTSLDELPQFWNVLKGEMSLVGPRPVVPVELKEYGDRVSLFLSMKPGITGYWQASGRSNVEYPERVEVELYYIRNFSLWLDIKILVKTIWVVLFQRGAY